MKMHVLTIGLNDKDTKTQIISDEDARAIVFKVCGDATITDAYGCYTHEDGTRVIEKSLRAEMLFKTDEEVKSFAETLKVNLNQESIVYEVKEVDSILV